ncbi:MAG: hypothetical protein AAGF56_11185, partial [Pseudomonadota bacterium]
MAKKSGKDASLTIGALAKRVERARVKGVTGALEDRVKRILASYLQTAQAHGMPVKHVVGDLASGQAAWRLGHAVRDEIMRNPPAAVQEAACASGCAFCC